MWSRGCLTCATLLLWQPCWQSSPSQGNQDYHRSDREDAQPDLPQVRRVVVGAPCATLGNVARLTVRALRCSIANNFLTGGYPYNNMSGVNAIAAALPNTQISDLK